MTALTEKQWGLLLAIATAGRGVPVRARRPSVECLQRRGILAWNHREGAYLTPFGLQLVWLKRIEIEWREGRMTMAG